jgi:hypothetical protein
MDYAHANICQLFLINNIMKAIQIISQDLFDKVRSRFTNLEMGDETGAVTIDPAEARFFDFDFVIEGNNLGRVSISLNELGSLKVYYSQGITENQDDPAKQEWYRFLKEMRFFSMRRLLRFDTRDIAKTNLDKNDFQHLAKTQAPKELNMPATTNESKWNQKSTKKTSRAVRGATEVIVRHAHAVDEEYAGSRSQRKNIKAIFIQNRDGERYKYPFIHPAGAFAMAQHVDHGGVPHDPAGKAIIRMSEQIAQLQEFQRQVQHTSLHDDAMGITERAVGRLQELKAKIEALGKRHHYESWVAEVNETEAPMLGELDPVTLETYKQKFTQTNFKEELANYFPLIHSIMQETNTIELEDYVGEGSADNMDEDRTETKDKDGNVTSWMEKGEWKKAEKKDGRGKVANLSDKARRETEKMAKSPAESIEYFEEWADATEQGKLADDEIEDLKQAITDTKELKLGPDGQTAWQFFNNFGLDDPDLEDKFKAAAEVDPETDPLEVFKLWADDHYPELTVALGMSGEAEPEAGAEAPPAEEPAAPEAGAEQPAAEDEAGTDPTNTKAEHDKGYGDASRGVDKNPYNPGSPSHGAYGKGQQAYNHSFGENEEMKGGNGAPTREGIVKEVAKIVKSFYNADNPTVGPFRGTENIALDCKKQVAEKFGDKAGEFAEGIAGQFIEKLTTEWHQKHDQVGDDGLARLKELVQSIKGRVEGIGDQGPVNKNIMPAEEKNPQHSHQYDTTMKHADNPSVQQRMAAHDIKPGIAGYRDRIDMLKDLERTGKLKGEHEGADMDKIPAYLRKQKQQSQDTAQKAIDQKNKDSGAKVWSSPRLPKESAEMESILKLAGLAK